jgi:formate dehydrogenase iron-sulfur subunit
MGMTRREFLKLTGAATIATAAAPLVAEAGVEHFEGNPDRYGMLTDTTLCIGLNCRRCEIACAKENNLPPIEKPPEDESVFQEVRRPHEHQFTVVNRFQDEKTKKPVYVKKQCLHCDEPACASACFVKALRKQPEGPVTYNEHVCVGCRYCMVACPFDVPAYEYHSALSPRVRKCTMCYETRTKHGQKPACAVACPNEVLTFGKRSDLVKLAYDKISRDLDRYVHHLYGEHEVGGTSWMFLSGVPFDTINFPTELGTAPLPTYTMNYLSAAPLVMAMWPAFFGGIYLLTKRRDELMKKDHAEPEDNSDAGKESR